MSKGRRGKGLTLYICFGKYDGFHFRANPKKDYAFQLILGWVSFAILTHDIEVVLDILQRRIYEQDG